MQLPPNRYVKRSPCDVGSLVFSNPDVLPWSEYFFFFYNLAEMYNFAFLHLKYDLLVKYL